MSKRSRVILNKTHNSSTHLLDRSQNITPPHKHQKTSQKPTKLSNVISPNRLQISRSSSTLKKIISNPLSEHPRKGPNLAFTKGPTKQKPYRRNSVLSQPETLFNQVPSDLNLPDQKPTQITTQQFSIYKQLFQEVIQNDKSHGFLLQKIKNAYEHYWNSVNQHLRKDLAQLKIQLKKEKSKRERAERKYQISESQASTPHFSNELQHLKKQVSVFKRKEKKYVQLLQALRNQGVPVEEIYNSMRRPELGEREVGVPKLQIPSVQNGEGFHEEFTSKIDEFSESWRKMINAHKT